MKAPIFVYYFCKLEGFEDKRVEEEKVLLGISASSVRTSNPNSEIWIITNPEFVSELKALALYDKIIPVEGVSKSNLDYMRVISQRDLVTTLIKKSLPISLAFIDHDTLVSTDLTCIFAGGFHFAAGCNFASKYTLDRNMLPTNTQVASINAGVQLVNVSQEALSLLNKKVALCRWIDNSKETLSLPLSTSPLGWGCDQVSMMLLFNREAFINRKDAFHIDGSSIRLFSTNIINYSPSYGKSITSLEFYDHWVWHFKGELRHYMSDYWSTILAYRA